MKIAVVSGGFDPIHSGHIAYLKSAAEDADKLIVLLNSDAWLENKKGQYFLPFSERKIILENLSIVSEVIDFVDEYGCRTQKLLSYFGEKVEKCGSCDHCVKQLNEGKEHSKLIIKLLEKLFRSTNLLIIK